MAITRLREGGSPVNDSTEDPTNTAIQQIAAAQHKIDSYAKALGVGVAMLFGGWALGGTEEFGFATAAVCFGGGATGIALFEMYMQHIFIRIERLKIIQNNGLLSDATISNFGLLDTIALITQKKIEKKSTAISQVATPSSPADKKSVSPSKTSKPAIPRDKRALHKRRDLTTFKRATNSSPQPKPSWLDFSKPIQLVRHWLSTKPASKPISDAKLNSNSDSEEIDSSFSTTTIATQLAAPSTKIKPRKKKSKQPMEFKSSSEESVTTSSTVAATKPRTVTEPKVSTASRPRSASDTSYKAVKEAHTTPDLKVASEIIETKKMQDVTQLAALKKAAEALQSQLETSQREHSEKIAALAELKKTASQWQAQLAAAEQDKTKLDALEKQLAASEEKRNELTKVVTKLLSILTLSEAKEEPKAPIAIDLDKVDKTLNAMQILVQQARTCQKHAKATEQLSEEVDIYGIYSDKTHLGEEFIKFLESISQSTRRPGR